MEKADINSSLPGNNHIYPLPKNGTFLKGSRCSGGFPVWVGYVIVLVPKEGVPSTPRTIKQLPWPSHAHRGQHIPT